MVSTAVASDILSEPFEALRFFLDPIKQVIERQSSGLLLVVRQFSILDTRYKLQITLATDVNWSKPFPTDFAFWESIQNDTPSDLAKSNTESMSRLYSGLSPAAVLDNSEYLKSIERQWSDLSVDIQACLIINENLTVYFMKLAEVR